MLTVDADHYVILRWDLKKLREKQVAGHGLLELTTLVTPAEGAPLNGFRHRPGGRDLGR